MKTKLFFIKYIFLSVLVVLFLIGVGGCESLSAQTLEPASLHLAPAAGSFKRGEVFKLDIVLDTGGNDIEGVDVYHLRYPKELLLVKDALPEQEGLQIEPGALFSDTVFNTAVQENGWISFSQVNKPGQYFNGTGTLASVVFEVVGTGRAELVFDFTQGETTDCNVVSSGRDVLGRVKGAFFDIPTAIESMAVSRRSEPPTQPAQRVSDYRQTLTFITFQWVAVGIAVIFLVVLLILRFRVYSKKKKSAVKQ